VIRNGKYDQCEEATMNLRDHVAKINRERYLSECKGTRHQWGNADLSLDVNAFKRYSQNPGATPPHSDLRLPGQSQVIEGISGKRLLLLAGGKEDSQRFIHCLGTQELMDRINNEN
jgi:hypothetical protein